MVVSSFSNNTYYQMDTYAKANENKSSENYNSFENSKNGTITQQEVSKTEDTTSISSETKKINTHLSQILLSAWFQKKLEEAKINLQHEQGDITDTERNNLAQNDTVKNDTFGNNTKVIDLAKFLENAEAFMANKTISSKSVNIKA